MHVLPPSISSRYTRSPNDPFFRSTQAHPPCNRHRPRPSFFDYCELAPSPTSPRCFVFSKIAYVAIAVLFRTVASFSPSEDVGQFPSFPPLHSFDDSSLNPACSFRPNPATGRLPLTPPRLQSPAPPSRTAIRRVHPGRLFLFAEGLISIFHTKSFFFVRVSCVFGREMGIPFSLPLDCPFNLSLPADPLLLESSVFPALPRTLP